MSRKPRFPISLPTWHEKRLLWWAYLKGVSKTALAQNVVQARVEANADMIELMLADLAADEGCSVEDLKQQILDGSRLSQDAV